MAIEFNCPYCTSTIRVKDAAAGKRGRCPRCSEQLLIPSISQAKGTPATPPPESPTASPTTPLPQQTVAVPSSVPVIPSVPSTSSRLSRPRRRRKSGGGLAVAILGLCFLAIVGLLGYQWWVSRPIILEGSVVGEIVGASNIKAATVESEAAVDAEVRESVLKGLQKSPYTMKSALLVTEFRATETDLQVRLQPTTATSIVRVSLQSDQNLGAWLAENRGRINSVRLKEVSDSVTQFFNDYEAYLTDGESMRDRSAYYRNRLGLGTMNVGLGYIVEAATDRQVCPCIFEDPAGNLYFAVPRGTTAFTIRGRASEDGKKIFSGSYKVDCGAVPEDIEVVEPDDKSSEADPDPTGSEESGKKADADDASDGKMPESGQEMKSNSDDSTMPSPGTDPSKMESMGSMDSGSNP